MDNTNKNQSMGKVSRALMEKAKQGFEFGKQDKNQPDPSRPQSNHTGIDRGRWAE